MHAAFQEIIDSFLESTNIPERSDTHPSAICHIQNSFTSYKTHLDLYHSLIHYLDSESLLLTRNLESGQKFTAQKTREINININKLNQNSNKLIDLVNHLNYEFSTLVAHRDFLNLRSPTFLEFQHFSNSIEFNVFFLNKDFTNEFDDCEQFKRLNLNKNDYLELDYAYQISPTPLTFLSNVHTLLDLKPSTKIALCNYEARHQGFLIYFDPNDTEVTLKFKSLSAKNQLSLYKLENSDSWVLNTVEHEFQTKELIECFDVWVDTNWLTIYLKESLFPIYKIKKITTQQPKTKCHLGAFFKHTKHIEEITKAEALASILNENPFYYPQKIMVFNGLEFFELTDQPFKHQYSLLLLSFFNGEDEQLIAYYTPLKKKVLLSAGYNSNEAKILIETYKLGLSILSSKPSEEV